MKKALYILAIAVMAAACSKGSRVNPDSAAVGGYSTYNSSPVGQYMMSIADDLDLEQPFQGNDHRQSRRDGRYLVPDL